MSTILQTLYSHNSCVCSYCAKLVHMPFTIEYPFARSFITPCESESCTGLQVELHTRRMKACLSASYSSSFVCYSIPSGFAATKTSAWYAARRRKVTLSHPDYRISYAYTAAFRNFEIVGASIYSLLVALIW